MRNKIFQSRDLCLRALDTNSTCAKNIYDDAENYMVKEGKYEGIMLCDVAKMDPNDLIEMARQGSLIEPELQRHAETLVKKYNL